MAPTKARTSDRHSTRAPDAPRRFHRQTPSAGHRLVTVIGALDRLPVLAHSHARLIGLLESENPSLEEVILTVESDVGLATAVLRAGAEAAGSGPSPGASVPECVQLLGDGLEATIRGLPVFDFFDRSSVIAMEAGRLRIHALATQRAAERIMFELRLSEGGIVPVAALLHDIGKIALALAWDGYEEVARAPLSPDARLVRERQAFGIDHATAGAVLARRLGLPPALASIVEHHHSEHAQGDAALIRLADMLAHYEAGSPIDANQISRAARAVGLDNGTLRQLLYEAPRAHVARRRHLEACPLSQRQLEIVRLLGEGKTYKRIATELGLSDSTVRSHIYGAYRKLSVNDRAQAVLLATDRGWI